MEWNEELKCWVCYRCEEAGTARLKKMMPPKAGVLAQLYDGERAP
jgi:hypothetical protein